MANLSLGMRLKLQDSSSSYFSMWTQTQNRSCCVCVHARACMHTHACICTCVHVCMCKHGHGGGQYTLNRIVNISLLDEHPFVLPFSTMSCTSEYSQHSPCKTDTTDANTITSPHCHSPLIHLCDFTRPCPVSLHTNEDCIPSTCSCAISNTVIVSDETLVKNFTGKPPK